MSDLEQVIQDSLNDAALPPEEPTPEVDEVVEAAPEPEAAAEPVAEAAPEPVQEGSEVRSPGARQEAAPAVQDEFEKKFGIPSQFNGRENRIPYSRMRKIIDKQIKETEAGFTPKIAEFEGKVKDYEGKIQTYETRLGEVAQFEKIMVEDPQKFLQLLSTLPQYQGIFNRTPGEEAEPVVDPEAEMPQPDQKMADGSMVYSMEGLKGLLAWQAKQVEKRVTSQVEERYKPIESNWQAQQKAAQAQHYEDTVIVPAIQKQIAKAQTWPMFTENEAAITEALNKDLNLSLEDAYHQVVFPKMTADRAKVREEVLKEIRTAPRSTSAGASAARPGAGPTGPRSLEDVIREQVATLHK